MSNVIGAIGMSKEHGGCAGDADMDIALIVLGVLILIPAFIGCYGACKEVKCLLYTHGALLGLLTLLMLIIAIVGYTQKVGI